MKICTCQFCGTITKVDWTKGPLPSCPNCQGVFDLEDIYDEEDEDFDNKETPVKTYVTTYTTTNGRVIKYYYNKNVNNVVDDSSTDTEPNEDDDEFDEDTQSMHKTIIDWARYNAVFLVALVVLIGGFVCFGWFLASEKTYATQDAMPSNNSAGGAEVRLVDNIIIENGEEGIKYEITAGLVDAGAERSETEENETESQDT